MYRYGVPGMSVFLLNTEYIRTTLVNGLTRAPSHNTLWIPSPFRNRAFINMAEGSTTRDVDTERSEMEPAALQPKRRRCLLLCGYCDRYLSKSTYYRHRDAYFKHASGQCMAKIALKRFMLVWRSTLNYWTRSTEKAKAKVGEFNRHGFIILWKGVAGYTISSSHIKCVNAYRVKRSLVCVKIQ